MKRTAISFALILLTALHASAADLPTLTPSGFTGDEFRLEVTGTVTSSVNVEVSNDLVNWGLLAVLTPSSAMPAVLSDPAAAGRERRFYRAFVAESQRLGETGAGYYDVEILSQPPRITFADSAIGTVWVGRLRPEDGLFDTATGRDQHVANFMTPLFTSSNGPEWGVDAGGASVYFTKRNGTQPQIWRAPLTNTGDLTASPLTSGDIGRLSPLPRNDSTQSTTRLIYLKGTYATGKIATLDVSNPGVEKKLDGVVKGVSGPRFIPGSDDFVLAMENGQLGHYVVATDTIVRLTDDAGSGPMTDPFAFRAPEMGNQVLIVAIENQQNVVVYQPPAAAGGFWTRRVTLPVPAASTETYVYSVKPFTVGGRSYFSLHLQLLPVTPPGDTTSSVWVYAMDPVGGVRLARRLDDGTAAHRIDPEWFIGQNEVFIYFNLLPTDGGPWQVHRARTGIAVPQLP